MYVSGIVLAAGNSVRFRTSPGDPDAAIEAGSGAGAGAGLGLGAGSGSGHGGAGGPAGTKQLLPYRGRTLLDAALDAARACAFDQRIVTLGGSVAAVRARVDLDGFAVVEVPAAGSGCGASVRTAVGAVDPRADGLVLLLGDQPRVRAESVAALIAVAGDAPIGVCRYRDGLGHPLWFRREVFAALRELHGDKAVWKLLHAGDFAVTEVPVDGPVPIDVDTPADYERLLAGDHLVG